MRKCRWGKIVLVASTMLLVMNLTACGKTNNEVLETNVTETVEVQEESTVSVANESMMAESVNTEEETTEEESVEPVVYEGIDMESTLPGKEWLKTFDGIITTPKFVIFNDNTNKKVIVEDGQEVEFEATDTLAIWTPNDRVIYEGHLDDEGAFCDNTVDMTARYFYDVSASVHAGDKRNISDDFEVDGEDVIIYATLIFK